MFGNFGGGYGYNKPSESIQKILSDKNKTLEDLLRDEDLIHELNSKNEQLFKYFNIEKIKKLIDYIIKEPEIDENAPETPENKDKGYKFPFICSQIFGLELEELLKYFFMTNKQIEEELKKENKEKEEKDKNKKDEKNKEEEKKENKVEDNNINKEELKKEEPENIKEDKKGLKNEQNELNNNNENNEDKKDIEKKEAENENKEEIKDKEKEKTEESDKKEEKKENDKEVKENIEVNKDDKKENANKEENIDQNNDDKNKEKLNEKEVEKNEKEEKIEENKTLENRIELIDYLFTFLPKEFDEGKKLNYVLCGYFSSLITNLLNVNPTVFIKYIYKERKDIFNLMTSHFYRKSISNALSRILYFENYINEIGAEVDEQTKNDMNETRNKVLLDIFSSIKIDMDNERLNSIYFFITEFFETSTINETKEIFKKMIENKNIIKALIFEPLSNLDLITNIDENKRKNFMIITDIIIFCLINIKKAKLDIPTCTSPESISSIKHTAISMELFNILPKLIENNFNKKNDKEKKILQSFDECQLSPLGEFKIKIVDLIYHLIPYFKKISKFFDEILIKSAFFKYGFDFLFEYEWNNLYQETFLSLLKTLLDYSEYHELLFNYLFTNLKIVEIIKSHTNKKNNFKFIDKGKDDKGNDVSKDISHGYISFLISLCYKINTVIGGGALGVNTNPSTEGSFEFIPKVNEENDNNDFFSMFANNSDDKNENNGKKENKEDEIQKGVPVESMKKYLNKDWTLFFNENIADVIKQYCDKNWPPKKKDMEIFDFLFQDDKDENKEENKEESKEENNEKKNENIDDNKENKEENKIEDNKVEKVEPENSKDENNNKNIDSKENKEEENNKGQEKKEEKIDNENTNEKIKEEDKKEVKEEKNEEKKEDKGEKAINEDNKNEKELVLEKKQNDEKDNDNNKNQNEKNEKIEEK